MIPIHAEYALLTEKEKIFLFNFTTNLKPNSILLEIGTFLGGSAALMASANHQIIIHTIDDYNNMHDRHKQSVNLMLHKALGTKPRTKKNVEFVLKDYKNIHLYKGKSPEDFSNWTDKIDVYFEDGMHKNPTLENNVNFWIKFLSNDGYLIFHDFRPFLDVGHPSRFDDVISIVGKLTTTFEIIAQEESLVILQKSKIHAPMVKAALSKEKVLPPR